MKTALESFIMSSLLDILLGSDGCFANSGNKNVFEKKNFFWNSVTISLYWIKDRRYWSQFETYLEYSICDGTEGTVFLIFTFGNFYLRTKIK